MNAEPRSNPVRCVVCLHAMTWADSARCDRCEPLSPLDPALTRAVRDAAILLAVDAACATYNRDPSARYRAERKGNV